MADSDALTTLRARLIALIRQRRLAFESELAQLPEDTVKDGLPQSEQPAGAHAQATSLPKPKREWHWTKRLFNLIKATAALVAAIFIIQAGYSAFRSWLETTPLAPWFAPALPKRQDSAHFTVAIAHLAHDDQEQHERLLIEELKALNVEILPLGRTIRLEATPQSEQQREEHGHAGARQYLGDTGADALIWGYVHTIDGKSAPRFYWTTAQTGRRSQAAYAPEQFHLPDLFWEDVVVVLRLLLTSADSQFIEQSGQFISDRLAPFIGKTRQLLENAVPGQRGWTAEGIVSAQFILANALRRFGTQSGANAPLEEAVTAYRAALLEWTRERAPLNWAMTQNNLGTALTTLGERESGTARLDEAVAAYRAALLEWTRERAPLNWAMTQNNLGTALTTLGKRESGTTRLEEAVAAYRAALEEYTREKVPLDWATIQNNLGVALTTLGERESGTARLDEAVAAYRAALLERMREQVPLDWAAAQNNLGTALQRLGERESGTVRLEAAVATYRTALLEYTRERVPLDWAMTQNNLGTALQTLGKREPSSPLFPWKLQKGAVRLQEAVTAYRAALLERTRERVPLDWAMTQDNLGTALQTLGERGQQASVGCQALESQVAAWEVFTGNAEYYATRARNNTQKDVALLRGKLASPEAQACLARHEAVLKRMGVE